MSEKVIVKKSVNYFMTQMKKTKLEYFLLLLLLPIMTWSGKLLAHGSNIKYRKTEAIEIQSNYESGSPMAKAQVTIYAPNNPSKPWLKGITDDQGKFIFIPDYSQTGNWQIKVRQSGHGNMINLAISENNKLTDNRPEKHSNINHNSLNNEYSSGQKLVMAIMVTWGFVGTALFFSRKKVQQ